MAYDDMLAERVRDLLAGEPGLSEKKMFGGLGFLLNGNLAVGVSGDALMVRIPAADNEVALTERGVRPFERYGRSMKGWLLVDPPGLADDVDLSRWVDRGTALARTFPPK